MLRNCLIILNIIFFAAVLPPCGVALAADIEFNDIKIIVPKAFEVVEPIEKKLVVERSKFSFAKIKKDWEPASRILSINKEKLAKENSYAKHVTTVQPDRTKYSAWEMFPLLEKQLNAYLVTADEVYLNTFLDFYNYFISVRMDNKGRRNYDGSILPQWERLDRYNIFTVSPYKKYDIAMKDKLMRERGWDSLFFSDVNYSGLILNPILRFVQIVKSNNLDQYKMNADKMATDAEKVIASHENEWVKVNDDSGYYIFPRNCPFFLDGVEMPVNEAALFGSALVRAYLVTGKEKYLLRAREMWERWKDYITTDRFGYISYPYFTGAPFEGWDESDNVSVNTPVFMPDNRNTPETFHKAAHTIDFLILLEQACAGSTVEYLEEFYYLMIAATHTNTLTSCFPRVMGFGYPLNTYHAALPFGFSGWVHLASQSDVVREKALNLLIHKGKFLNNLLYFQFITEKDIEDFEFISFSETISPAFLDDDDGHCLWRSPVNGVVNLKFQHTSPKHNTLYLYDPLNDKTRIRMNLIDGAFYSAIYPAKNQCVDIRWKRSRHGAPESIQENKLTLIYYKKKSEFIKEVGGSESVIVSPRYLADNDRGCLWNPPVSGSVGIEFKHTSPKHNTLYLYDYKNESRKIKLRVKDGVFLGKMYVKKDECIDLRWKQSKHGAPNNVEENKIAFRYHKSQIVLSPKEQATR